VSSSKTNLRNALDIDPKLRLKIVHWLQLRATQPWVVALSGGAHSAALLKAIVQVAPRSTPVRALHVHHGFANSDALALAAQQIATRLGVSLTTVSVVVTAESNLEEAAREARYGAFENHIQSQEILALAHHRADQAETFLMRLMRGAGMAGLAAMAEHRPCGLGELVRPWLTCEESAVRSLAQDLPFVEDPMNEQEHFDRVFIRRQLMPLLKRRWPAAEALIERAVGHIRAQSPVAVSATAPDILGMGSPRCLPADELRALARAQRFELLRAALNRLNVKAPPLAHCLEFDRMLFGQSESRRAVVRLGEWEARIAQDLVYLGPALAELGLLEKAWVEPGAEVGPSLGALGRLTVEWTKPWDEPFWLMAAPGSKPISVDGFQGTRSSSQWLKLWGYPHWVRDRALVVGVRDEILGILLATDLIWVRGNQALPVQLRWEQAPVWLTDKL